MNVATSSPSSATRHDPALATGERRRKRQKITQACENCRDRKTRCDGRRPVCVACEQRGDGESCHFVAFRRRRLNSARAIARPTRRDISVTQTSHDRSEPRKGDLCAGNASESTSDPPWSGAQSDGLATLAGNSDAALYGPSSTIAFLRHVMDNESRSGTSSSSNRRDIRSHESIENRGIELQDNMRTNSNSIPVLPAPQHANDFVRCYWEFIHPMFPMLHKPSFMNKFELCFCGADNSPRNDSVFASILNLVFALGSKFSDLLSPRQRNSVADEFYQDSKKTHIHNLFDSTSEPVIQMLLLEGVYLQSTRHANRCWNVVGLAIRIAQSMGLHREHPGSRVESQMAREMRRRIWHVCVSLDRLLAMTFGRPPMVDDNSAVPLPAMIDDECLQTRGEGIQPVGEPSRLGMFVASCRLFDHLQEVLRLLMENDPAMNSGTTKPGNELVVSILELNNRLDLFSADLPGYLQFRDEVSQLNTVEDHVQLQRRVLYCRFLLTRLLLLRPLLLTASKTPFEPDRKDRNEATPATLQSDVIRSCCQLCIQTAFSLIEVIYHNIGTLYRSSGWHAVYFTFSAAIVLLASMRGNAVEFYSNDDHFEESWTRCIDILNHYEEQIHSASQAILVLKALRDQIDKHKRMKSAPSEAQSIPQASSRNNPGSAVPFEADTMLQDATLFPGLEHGNPLDFNSISDAWFGQHIMNLDWLEGFQLWDDPNIDNLSSFNT